MERDTKFIVGESGTDANGDTWEVEQITTNPYAHTCCGEDGHHGPSNIIYICRHQSGRREVFNDSTLNKPEAPGNDEE